MKYIWEIFLDGNYDVTLRQAKRFSPYSEMAEPCLNKEWEYKKEIAFNSLYRYEKIVTPLLQETGQKYDKESQVLFDVLIHYLILVDTRRGLTEREMKVRFLEQELEEGNYGMQARAWFQMIQQGQRHQLAYFLLQVNETGSSVTLFRNVLFHFFEGAAVYKNKLEKNRLLVYLDKEKTDSEEKVLEAIKELFLPLGYTLRVFWNQHFGIIGEKETMHFDRIEIF